MIHHLFLLLWFSGQTPSSEAIEHLRAGVAADKQHQFDTAIVEFRKATDLDPNLAEGFVSLGQAYMEKHEYGNAIQPLKQAVELKQDLIPAHQLLGYALLVEGYAADAIAHLKQAHETGALGIAEIETGQLKEAIANLQAALEQRPNDPDLLYYLGRASGLLSKESVDTLMAIYPNSARSHQAMGENYFVLRQIPQAERDFLDALKQGPDTPELHLELGDVYAKSSQWEKAEAEFRAQTKLQPGNAEAAYRLGSALLQQGKAHEAREQLSRADHLRPEMPETLYALGKTALLEGDVKEAEKSWLKLLSIEKDSDLAAQTHFALAGLYRKQGKVSEAEQEMQEFQKLQNVNPGQPATGPH